MGKKLDTNTSNNNNNKETTKVEAVLELIRKQTPLTVKQVFLHLTHLNYFDLHYHYYYYYVTA